MLFSFCYLFFLQGEILAEAQFVYSKGITSYNILIGAGITEFDTKEEEKEEEAKDEEKPQE